ncbi:MAG: hypothetical protein AAB299_01715 [Thermodesulfobacteriota bacterium]
MPFQTCLTILICLILGISGCMKAVAPKMRWGPNWYEGKGRP